MQEVELADRQQDDARPEIDRLPKQVVDRRKFEADLDPAGVRLGGLRPDPVLDLEFRRHLQTVGDVRVEEGHKPLLVERTAASPGAGLPWACPIAAVEQPVLQVHVPADRGLGRGHERLGVDGSTTAGS